MSCAKVAPRSQCSAHSVLPYKIWQIASNLPPLTSELILPKGFALWTPVLYPAKAGYKKGVYRPLRKGRSALPMLPPNHFTLLVHPDIK